MAIFKAYLVIVVALNQSLFLVLRHHLVTDVSKHHDIALVTL